ncbi:HAD family hydrolase [Prauserella cavernicola]|uniref:HAD family hydrolase n=1 Tax=Prauserella cavernicola TaxID=2800127 RepID=A0A934V417_9PSEU|nr:HAD family hydrolase [Prauserella cavernicola]MBK1783103.1 HAD family hydrolase [Prauserella cavernicola]
MTARREPQVLIFDADDTLWENNILFERVIDGFLDWLTHPALERAALRAMLDDIERANSAEHGYGSTVFLRSLGDCVARLRERPATVEELRRIDELAVALVEGRIELIPGVTDTLTTLGQRHELFLLTKGNTEEQSRKIAGSGLERHFGGIHIVAEKSAQTYHDLAREYSFDLDRTWMIGNSPKSDILPAREAGLGAVFIPNANTWVLEHDELDLSDGGVLHLEAFPGLVRHF